MPPPLEYMDLTDKAVLWEWVRADRDGMSLIASPVEICVRWEEGQNEMLTADGQRIPVDVQMATTRNIPIGSIIWEGSLTDLDTLNTNRIPNTGIYEVIMRIRAKDLKGCVTRYEFGCKRYKDTLPKVVA